MQSGESHKTGEQTKAQCVKRLIEYGVAEAIVNHAIETELLAERGQYTGMTSNAMGKCVALYEAHNNSEQFVVAIIGAQQVLLVRSADGAGDTTSFEIELLA